jgi:hypothetical protein
MLRLRSIFLAGIVDMLSPAIGSSDTHETTMIEIEAQSYVGKSPVLKGIGELYGGLWWVFRVQSIGRRKSWPAMMSVDR